MADSNSKLKILAVPCAFNEEGKIGRVLDRFNREDVDRILVVNDGSTDRTAAEIEARGLSILSHDRQMGAGASIRDAINYGRENGFGIVVFLAGNNKDDPTQIPLLTGPIERDEADFVQGSRYTPGGDFGNMPLYRQIATRFVHPWLFSLVSGKRITDSTNGFRAIRLSIFDDPRIDIGQPWLDRYELEPYIFCMAIKLGYRVREVPVTKIYPPKKLGYTKMKPITGWWSMLRPLIYLALGIRK